MQRRFYPELESLRGVAALFVVIFHIYGNVAVDPQTLAQPTFNGIAALILTSIFGGTGCVTLFFVLSGFVLAESLAGAETIDLRASAAFWVGRFFRLVPTAWASLVCAAAIIIFIDRASVPWDEFWRAAYFNFDAVGRFNGPLWSINVESVGSAVFPALLLITRKGRWLGGIALLIALVWLQPHRDYFYAPTYLFCFQLGILVQAYKDRLRRALPARAAAMLLLPAVILVLTPTNICQMGFITEFTHVKLEAIGATFLIFYFASYDGDAAQLLRSRPLRLLGRISYSLYAFHFLVIHVLEPQVWRFFPPPDYLLPQTMCVLIIVPMAILCAAAVYALIERPSHRFGRAIAARIAKARTGHSVAVQLPT